MQVFQCNFLLSHVGTQSDIESQLRTHYHLQSARNPISLFKYYYNIYLFLTWDAYQMASYSLCSDVTP